MASSTVRGQMTRTETAATGSRRVRKTVLPRRVSSAICPSTQTRPRRLIHSLVSRRMVRTGTGASGEVSRAMAIGCGGFRLATARTGVPQLPSLSLMRRRSNMVITAGRPSWAFS